MSIFAVLLALTFTFSSAADVEIPLEKYELPNGLDVILAPDRSTPIVYVSIWYHVGSKDERTGLTGFAHLFEHLMFQGSLSNDGEYFAPLERLGASINGTTSFDRTNYYEVLPSQHLPVALFVESDRMGYLLDVLSQEKLDNQREVVRNERRQNVEDRPYGNAYQLLLQGIYPPSHPYSHLPIGSHEDLQAASLEDVIAFFQTWYVPNNASLVVAGDIDIDATKQMIRTHFGGIPAGPQPERIEAQPVTMTEGKRIVDYDDVPEQRVWMAWHSPRLFQEGDAELDLLASTLTAGEDSRPTRYVSGHGGVVRRAKAAPILGVPHHYGVTFSVEAAAPGVVRTTRLRTTARYQWQAEMGVGEGAELRKAADDECAADKGEGSLLEAWKGWNRRAQAVFEKAAELGLAAKTTKGERKNRERAVGEEHGEDSGFPQQRRDFVQEA